MRIALRLGGLIAAIALAGLQTVSAAASSSQTESPAPTMFNPCNGEAILTTGFVRTFFVSNGRHLHWRMNLQDVKGVGAVTGFDYVITGSSQIVHGNFNPSNLQDEFTTLTIVHIVAPGTGQHFTTVMLFHFNLTPSFHSSVTSHSDSRCISMSAPGHLVVGERVTSTSSTAKGDTTPSATASTAPTAGATTWGPGAKAESRESSAKPGRSTDNGVRNGVRSHGLKSKAQ